jgi:cyanophycinase
VTSRRSLVFSLALVATGLDAAVAMRQSTAGYDYYITGNPADVAPPTRGGLALVGGGTDIDDVYRWMIARSGGGDFVVLRGAGDDAYNPYIYGLGGADSVETLVIKTREAASHPFVVARVRSAEAVFIGGGDQSRYVRFWRDTGTEAAIDEVANRPAPVGGTSAGLAVLGEFSFSALEDTVTSQQVLSDPYDRRVTLDDHFLSLPLMKGIITDSHFIERDRMGRLLGFLARLVADGRAKGVRAIAVDRETALLVDPDGSARVVGNPGHPTRHVFFLRTPGAAERCVPGATLQYRDVPVYRLSPDGSFDLKRWAGTGGIGYTLTAREGAVHSTQAGGAIY